MEDRRVIRRDRQADTTSPEIDKLAADRRPDFRQCTLFPQDRSCHGIGLFLLTQECSRVHSLGLDNGPGIEQRPDRDIRQGQPGCIESIVTPPLATLNAAGQFQTQGGPTPGSIVQVDVAEAGRLEFPAILPDGDDADQAKSGMKRDDLTQGGGRTDPDLIRCQLDDLGPEDQVAPAAAIFISVGFITAINGNLYGTLPLVDLLQATTPPCCS